MENFNSIIKQKADQFEVSFNEAHWVELEERLNTIRSKRNKKLFFGSAAIVITLLTSAYFIIPSTNNLNTNTQTPTKDISIPTPAKPVVSVAKTHKEVIEEVVKSNSEASTITASTTKLPAVKKSKEKITQKQPIVIAEKKNETIEKESSSSLEKVEILKERKSNETSKPLIEAPTKKTIISPEIQTEEAKTPSPVITSKTKSVIHKAYEDENVSKKSLKRRSGGILSFLSFKKRRYKVPLSKRKTSKRKK